VNYLKTQKFQSAKAGWRDSWNSFQKLELEEMLLKGQSAAAGPDLPEIGKDHENPLGTGAEEGEGAGRRGHLFYPSM
jgi:hypothetical protein